MARLAQLLSRLPRPRTTAARALLLAALPLFAACPGTQLKRELVGVKANIDQARNQGAYLCAPVELAMAESHYDFTAADLYYGDYLAAKDNFAVAERNAREALEKSPPNACKFQDERPIIVPKVGDRDGDGLLDDVDKCPDDPEDKDGFEDEDGCPDPDNDKDGVLDVDDKCPLEPGPKENLGCPDTDKDKDTVVDRLDKCPDDPGPPSNAGCPEKKYITITQEKIELKEQVQFATGKAKINPESFELLNEVVDLLKKNPTIKLRIEGHTDTKGNPKKNIKLSQDRAKAVNDYLVEHGIDQARLTSEGYGQTCPVADNKTVQGREKNRRTDFFIARDGVGSTCAPLPVGKVKGKKAKADAAPDAGDKPKKKRRKKTPEP